MLRRASVLLGLAVLLSLLFPVRVLLKEGGIEPSMVGLGGIDLAGICALVAVLPAVLLARDAELALRMPRWNPWIALLALFSLLFLLLHVSWAEEWAGAWVREGLAQGGVHMSDRAVLQALEFSARLGVLVCLVGVLVNLESVPDGIESMLPRRGRK